MASLLDPEVTFASLADSTGLDVRLRKAIARMGHVRPTLVQSKCLPLAISSGRDLMVRAKTGSGKTLAYCLPLLHKVLTKNASGTNSQNSSIQAVILVPTRELCSQVHSTLQSLTSYCDEIITPAVLSAGHGRGKKAKEELTRQKAMLRDRPDILVATPTGLSTHISSGAVELGKVETLVVDEADLVLSFGHENAVHEIIKALPKIYQGFLMSATLSAEVNSIKKVVLHSPVVLTLEEDEDVGANRSLKQFYLSLPKKDKGLVVYVFLKLGLLKGKGLFFVNTTDAAYRLKLLLEQFHIRSSVLNGELPIHSRLNIIEQFNVGNFDYLIATDESAASTSDNKVDDDDEEEENDNDNEKKSKKGKKKDEEYGVARGLDFRNVSFVVNVDFPKTPKSYAHRVGRTARGGGSGVALSLVELESQQQLDMLEKVQEDQPELLVVETAAADNLQAASTVDGSTQDEAGPAPKTQSQPAPLDFDLNEIEGFRYRVEDVSRAVTRIAVQETRAAELKAEILNSERLQNHFEDNPSDLQLLRHDRVATHVSKVQDHLKHVPKYLLPRGMQVAKINKKRKKKKARVHGRREDNDPLRSFDGAGDVDLDDVAGNAEEDDELADFFEDDGDDEAASKKLKKEEGQIFTSAKDAGKSTAGRNQWKERHRKGKFSSKKRMSDRVGKPMGL